MAVFDPRLLTAEQLLALAGDFPLRLSEDGAASLFLDCAECGRGIEMLTDTTGEAYEIRGTQLLANVLRHRVMRHDLALSGRKADGGESAPEGPGAGGGDRAAGRADRGRDPGHRPADQERDPGRVDQAAGRDSQ